MSERDNSLSTEQRALEINLDERKYGTIVEIGAGQEVARQFFKAGAAAGTIAKTMSAYDMKVSDEIYGRAGRYVSRTRLEQMLDREFDLLLTRLEKQRREDTTFFAFADTVAAKGYKTEGECHGWMGLRYQLKPGQKPCQIIVHLRMLDNSNHAQSEALGILGVNLIHAAYNYSEKPQLIIESLGDGLTDRIEIDLIHFSGPDFSRVDNRLMNLHLIRAWLTRAVMYNADGEPVVPSEQLYKKSALVIRGAFMPPTKFHVDMANTGLAQLNQQGKDDALVMAEISMSSVRVGGDSSDKEFLSRADLINSLGYDVLVSDYLRTFTLRSWIRRYTNRPIGIVVKATDCNFLFDESFYDGLEGGILEAMGKLFADDTRMFVYPVIGSDGKLVELENLKVPSQHKHLLKLLVANGKMLASQGYSEKYLDFSPEQLLELIAKNDGNWQKQIPDPVQKLIIKRKMFNFPG